MSTPVRQFSFSSGEIAPSLYARTDLNRYENGLRTARNMIVMRHGGVTGRPGTQYVATTLNNGNPVRLIPFIFNETGLGQSYVLEFGNLYVAFYQNGGVVTSGGNPYTIVSPYAQADLATLQFDQCADIVTIVHPNYPPYELARVAALNWTLTAITFAPGIAAPGHSGGSPPDVTGTAGSVTLVYHVTAVSATGEESVPLQCLSLNNALQIPTSSANAATIVWAAVAAAAYYRIYNYQSGVDGFIGTTASTSFVDNGYKPDFTQGAPVSSTLFASSSNYPSTVGFVQQRRGFAATNNNPLGFWLSQPGRFANLTVRTTPLDSDAVIAQIAGTEVNSIQHLVELKFMLLLTAGAEIYVQGNGSGIVTPSTINASTQSQYGCAPIRPLKLGDVLIFNQALGSFIRDFAFDFAIDGYRGNDITVFASHLFEGYQLNDWCYQKIPDSIVWAARSDGQLLSCTYVREQQILAWTHHDMQNGLVQNVCAIPENGQYSVYMTVQRVINGSTVVYIERMSSRLWPGPSAAVTKGIANSFGDPMDATYLDCWAAYDGRNTGSATMTLTASGGFQTGTTAYQQQLTLTSSAAYFGAGQTAQVGDQIFLEDALWVSSQGSEGNLIRLTIQAVTSSTVVTVTPSGVVPSTFQSVAISLWARAVSSLSGITYLAGQQVSVWADRFLVGSPLNSRVRTVYTVSNAGTLTLDKPYSVIYVGLPMIQDVQTLDLECYFGETFLSRRKRVARLSAYLYNTRSFFCGSENPDKNLNNTSSDPLFQLYEEKRGAGQVTYDQPPELITDQDYVITESRWNRNGRLFIRNVDPVPFSLLALSPGEEDPGPPNSFYKRP